MENNYSGGGLSLVLTSSIMLYYCKQCRRFFLLKFEGSIDIHDLLGCLILDE